MIGGDTCTAQWLCDQLCSSPATVSEEVDVGVLVLDCRSADEYLAGHVAGSLSVVVPSIMMRRLRNGSASVAAVVSDASARSVFVDRCRTSHIVLYDAMGGSSEVVASHDAADSVVQVLMNRLKKDGCRVSYLLGGFVSFRREFGHHCVERRPAATAATHAAADVGDDGPAAARHQLAVDDNISGLSNLRLSSSAPSSSYLDSCRSPLRCTAPEARPRRPAQTPVQCVAAAGLPFPVQVLSNLYLGDAATARNLQCLRRHNIEYIVNVTADVENAFEGDSRLTYMRIAITDHWSETPTSFFTSAINFIEEGRKKNVGVLVHCLAGISRSVTVTVAYLMFSMSLSLEDAYEFLRRVRPNISPNFNFMGQLADFDQTLSYARQHCTCLSANAPRLNLCENCRQQVKTYFSSPTSAATVTAQINDDISTTLSSSSSPFSTSSLTSSTSMHSLPSPGPK